MVYGQPFLACVKTCWSKVLMALSWEFVSFNCRSLGYGETGFTGLSACKKDRWVTGLWLHVNVRERLQADFICM